MIRNATGYDLRKLKPRYPTLGLRAARADRWLPSRGREMFPPRPSPGAWAPPKPLDAAIIFAVGGDLVPLALKAVRKGGRVVCACIHMSDIPSFPYRLLWEERQIVSVANLQDGLDFLRLAPEIGIVTHTTTHPLNQANQALADLRAGRFEGAAVLVP